jgi:imidazolonepropionase-like amidohydrolase
MRLLIGLLLAGVMMATCRAQGPGAAEPIVGLRENRPDTYALVGGKVVAEPGRVMDGATVLIEGTSILAVADDVPIPAGAKTIDCDGRTIYAGLIDAWSESDVPVPESDAAHWNGNVTPQRMASAVAGKGVVDAAKLRSQGIAIRVVAPRGGIIKGSSSVVLLGDGDAGRRLLRENAWQHLQLTVPREGSRSRYPNSPMGATALLRQSLYDARWYRDAWNAYRANTTLTRPETNVALDTLAEAMDHHTFVIDAPNERMSIRADSIAREFSLQMIIRGSGREYRQLDEIAGTHRAILVPVDFPDTPNVKTSRAAKETSLQELMHWDLAPQNPARLVDAGVSICLTTDGLSDVDEFLEQVRRAVKGGLSEDAALTALTTAPARLLQLDHIAGSVKPGMLANLLITDGELFSEQTKVLESWVAGRQFVISSPKLADADELVGRWPVRFRAGDKNLSLELEFTSRGEKITGVLREPAAAGSEKRAAGGGDDQDTDAPEPASAKLSDIVRQRDRLTASVELQGIDSELADGVSRIQILTLASDAQKPSNSTGSLSATIALPSGQVETIQWGPKHSEADRQDVADETVAKSAEQDTVESTDENAGREAEESVATNTDAVKTPVLYPLGAYGASKPSRPAEHVMLRGASIWTCDETGILESADLIIEAGRIVAVGKNLAVPGGCRVVDVRGKHITPGLIDCHSHMGTDGGVNESGQTVTAEVRIGDFIDNSDITIYRQLAGGLTTSNILHGSANPIGGQNQVIKLRWGDSMEGLRMEEAPPGIKFALGENVKRTQSRYPNTRMGVEQIIRDQLLAARQYDADWRRWRSGDRDSLPPRRDLQLQAMAEVQRGERWIHCHSYRQDEIYATLDLLDEFGVQIGTLQHILEGYKVADRLARHGAMASAFSDWWAYKFEVYDAIPYNGAIMHDRGIVVSFNSDDREIGRRLNTEAAKATKYGGVSEEEALKFVTLNPAKQLRIDQYVGSIAVGKHADLVVWSGRPLSTMSRCEQTWIDGRQYFDLHTDQQIRQRDVALRARLIQKALRDGKPSSSNKKEQAAEEDRWLRRDIYCSAYGALTLDDNGREQNQ